MGRAEFVHLHLHSEYSLLDGASRVSALAGRAAELGMPAMAMTDHGAMYGVLDFYQQCREQGVKPILGCETYVAPRSRFDKTARVDDEPYHFVLLAKDRRGWTNLTKLVSAGFLEGFYYKPRVDRDLLAEHAEGLIALSACLGAEVPQLLLQDRLQAAEEAAAFYRDAFGPENFFLELQDHGIPEQRRVNRALVEMSKRLGVGLVATNDAHYLVREDAYAHDVLLCIQTAANLDSPKRLKFPTEEFYVKTPEEMAALFGELPESLSNTLEIAERCNLEFEFGKLHLPHYDLPEGFDAESYLRKLCLERLPQRYADPSPEVRQRLDYELDMICRMGYAGYFLIVWDFIDFARSRGIPVGPGRGSAAGSMVAYVLGITNIDPLRYGLVFERFLNPERVDMPDIDIDFCYERRDEVIRYVSDKYGADCVAQIITFGTMGAKAVIRDVGRAMGLGYGEVDRIAKLVPNQLHMTLDRALESEPEMRRSYEEDETVRRLIDAARRLEGLPRHPSVHAAGVVIAHEPLVNLVPLARTQDGNVVTQFNMDLLKEIGVLKMDFLGLRTLTVLQDAVDWIERTTGARLDLDNLPLDDARTYEMLSRGQTVGVFQLESNGMTTLMRDMRADGIDDIIATVALFRPGPMELIPAYIEAKRSGQLTYPHPRLEPILQDTNGIPIYQEQILQIASAMAGFSLGEADMLRRAMGKKKKEIMDEYRDRFVRGCVANGHGERLAVELFDMIEKFAGYAFNRAHSACYGVVAYQTAYLKANHPVQYMAALLTSVMGDSTKVADYVAECRRLGVRVLPPDVNESEGPFTVVGDAIRFGLSAVKNVGAGAIESVVRARAAGGPFDRLADFLGRVDLRQCNRRALESLIKAGAFDSLGAARSRLAAGLDRALEAAQSEQKRRAAGQVSLFSEPLADELPAVAEYPQRELLAQEKEMLGIYLSGHPLEAVADRLARSATPIRELAGRADGDRVTVGGLVAACRRASTRRGEAMAFATLEDLGSQVEVVAFPKVFAASRELLAPDALLVVRGKVSWRDEQVTVVADEVSPLIPAGGPGGPDGVRGGEAAEDRSGGGPGGATVPWDGFAESLRPPEAAAGPEVRDGRQEGAGVARRALPAAAGPPVPDWTSGPDRPLGPAVAPPSGGAHRDAGLRSGAAAVVLTGRALHVRLPESGDRMLCELLRAVLRSHPGRTPVFLYLPEHRSWLRAADHLAVSPGEELLREVEDLMGAGSARLLQRDERYAG